ncbi:nidogen-2 [Rhinophrynus dorsalis]
MRPGALPLLLFHLHCLLLGLVAALSRQELFPYGEQRGDSLLQEGDDETSEVVKLAQPLLFYEAHFSQLYVGTNGIISTQDFPRETQYVDDVFPTDFPVIAAFLSDIDTSNGKGKIYYRQDNSEELLNHAAEQVHRGFPEAAFTPSNTFLVTWENVGAYEEVTRHSAPSNRFNTFQAVLAYDESDSYAIFLYPEDGLQFFGTRPKESYNVHLELPARVGFSRGESEALKREGPYYTVTAGEQSVKNLYQLSNVGIPGLWVFHIGSLAELDNVVPAKFGNVYTRDRSLSPGSAHRNFSEHRSPEDSYTDEGVDYPETFYDEDLEYTSEATDVVPTHNANPELDSNTGSRGYLDIDDPAPKLSHADVDQESTLPNVPSRDPIPPSHGEPNWTPYESGPDREEPLVEPQVQPGENIDHGNPPSTETREEPLQSATDDLPSHNVNVNPHPEHGAIPSNPASRYPESDVTQRSHPGLQSNYRRGQIEGNVGLDADVFPFHPPARETCERNHGKCSHHAFCTDYTSGFCCHCQEDYYGNGIHCLPKGAPQRVNGKVSGNILVGQTPVTFSGADLHSYIVVNDGRAYTAISHVPEPASWSLTPLLPIGGLFGWLFALEKPGHQNGFSITGAKFVHNIEVTFYPGEETFFITQAADGFDSENYINVKTTMQGKIPYIPETSTIQISSYNELYHYTGSVVTSTSYREYTVTSQSNEVQKLSYRLRQNITYHDCVHSKRLLPGAQRLNVERAFALYNKDEKVIRYAITNHIGSVQGITGQEQVAINPCYDGSHVCDTRAKCQPATGLNYTCVCASGYHGDGRECSDVNECEVGFTRCGQNTVCVNLPGSYRCECASGYTFSPDGHHCVLVAPPADPCADGSHTCNRETSRCVPRGDGVFTCECLAGFIRSGQSCIDLDECTQNRCHPDASCTNTPGSFSCVCNNGFEGDGFQCTQILGGHTSLHTPCLEKRRQLLGHSGTRPLVGQFVPECDMEGNYTPLQCHGSTGHCWCVNKLGEEIQGTRIGPGNPAPRCDVQEPSPLHTPCLERRRQLLGHSGTYPLVGQFVPECDQEGNYNPLQCHGSTGHCWCVNKHGEEVHGTRSGPGSPTPRCGDPDPLPLHTPCLEKRRQLLGHIGAHPAVGQFVPECDQEGNYTPLQCHGSTGHCWCVDKHGEEIHGTRTPPGSPAPRCGVLVGHPPLHTPCLEKRRQLLAHSAPHPVVGQFVPECDQEGNYTPMQCHGSTGHCWCVNQHGEEVQGTRTPPGSPAPRCGVSVEHTTLHTPCLEKRRQLLGHSGAQPVVGQFVPDCDQEGNYVPLQCHGSTGHCWCVNNHGEEVQGTRTAPGRPTPQCGELGNTPLRTPCLEKRRQLLGHRGGRPLVGQFVPECDQEGNYTPLQCHGSTGHCWCVNDHGEEIQGTRTPPGSSTPRCGVPEPTQRPQTVCERWKQSLIDHYSGSPSGEHYIPQCDAYGDFSPLQCHGNSGYCWCVDKEGREIQGSRTQPGMTPACIPTVAPPTLRPTPRPDVSTPATGTFLLYAQGQQIGYLPLNGTRLHKEKARTLLSLHGSIVVGIDYDCQEKMVYWTDVAGRTINRASLEPGAEPETIISSGLMSTEGLAIDFLRRTMFWTDSGLDKIESSRLDGSERKILFDTQLVNPRAITVDAIRGNLYWTDWNREAPKIETSFVDGSNRRILVNDNIGLPNGLTFDPFSKQICWADAGTKKLECIQSNGSGRRVIQSNLNYPFSVVAYANHFYHTDWRRDGVISVNKDNGQIIEEYLPEQRSHLYGITAVYPYCPSGRK